MHTSESTYFGTRVSGATKSNTAGCIPLKHNSSMRLIEDTCFLSCLSSYQINSELREVLLLQRRAHARDATSRGETLAPLTNCLSNGRCFQRPRVYQHLLMRTLDCTLRVSQSGFHIREPPVMDTGFRAHSPQSLAVLLVFDV